MVQAFGPIEVETNAPSQNQHMRHNATTRMNFHTHLYLSTLISHYRTKILLRSNLALSSLRTVIIHVSSMYTR